MSFKDKIIWITGASSGIGEALAKEWAVFKPELILSGRNLEKLEEVKSNCEKLGASCKVVSLDLTNPVTIATAAKEVLDTYGWVDILVNNGGISQRSTVLESTIAIDRHVMETNFFGAVAITKAVLPSMVNRKSGHIVVISSVVGKFGFPMRSAYSASKHALQGFFDSLRAENVSNNIAVTIVSPGRINTNISLNAIDKTGGKHGVMDPGQAGGMPAPKCARIIITAVRKKKKDILIGRKELLMVYFRRFLPAIYFKMASNVRAV